MMYVYVRHMPQTAPTLCAEVDGRAIRAARSKAGLTVRDVAAEVGIGAAFLYHLEVGSRSRLALPKFEALATTLGVDRSELLAEAVA